MQLLIEIKPVDPDAQGKKITLVEPDKLNVPNDRSYAITSSEKIAELTQSIEAQGICVPLDVVSVGGQLQLTDGWHRLMAAMDLKMPTVPCIIKDGSWKDVLIRNMSLNKHRGRSDPVGESRVLRRLVEEEEMPIHLAAKNCGISESWGRRILKIQQLPETVIEWIRTGDLAVSTALHLLVLKDPEKQLEQANFAKLWGWTEEDMKDRVNELINPDYVKAEGSVDFLPSGEKVVRTIDCFACGKDTEGQGVVVWLHPECRLQLEQALESEVRAIEAETVVNSGGIPPQPVHGQQPNLPFPLPTVNPPPLSITMEQLMCQHDWIPLTNHTAQCRLCGLYAKP